MAEHAGWANVLCVAARGTVPAVVERRRVTLIDADLPTQPYHHESLAMTEGDANALIARVRTSIAACAFHALQRTVADLASTHVVTALAVRMPPFAELPETVAVAWTSYRLLCAADGMMYQLAICDAARRLALEVDACPRGEETSRAAERLHVTPEAIEDFVSRTGRPPGPPWTEEHRRAYAAGIATLALHMRGRLSVPGS